MPVDAVRCRRDALRSAVALETHASWAAPTDHRPGCADWECRCPPLRGAAFDAWARDRDDTRIDKIMRHSVVFDRYLQTGATEPDYDAELARLVPRE